MKTARKLLVLMALLAVAASAGAGDPAPVAAIKGPWLQNVTTSAITIMWQTDVASGSRVEFGESAEYGQNVSDATPVTRHEVRLTGLSLDTRYHYRVTSTTTSSPDHTFQTAVATSAPFRFAVYGDSRTNAGDHAAVVASVLTSSPRFVLHTGDLVGDGRSEEAWAKEYFAPAAPLLAEVAVYACLGNHEQNADLYYRYVAPPKGGGDSEERWYSFDYGCAHFTVLDTNADYAPGSAQYTWLVNDLKRATAKWRFVMHHHPAYSSGAHGSTPEVQRHLAPLYEKYGVSMVFSGHDHHYERSRKGGVCYVVAGGGGAPGYPANLHKNPYQQYAEQALHHCLLDVTPSSVILRAIRADGSVMDTVTLKSALPQPRARQ